MKKNGVGIVNCSNLCGQYKNRVYGSDFYAAIFNHGLFYRILRKECQFFL